MDQETQAGRPLGLPRHALVLAVRFYQATLSPLFGGHCRYVPSCSEYAIQALSTHGAVRGLWLTVRRLLRCHPLGGAGYDPVPENLFSRGSQSRASEPEHTDASAVRTSPSRDDRRTRGSTSRG